jgi:predicted nucleic acid-binding protein
MKKATNNRNPPPAKQDIILDTCILQYLSKKQVSKELLTYLFDLISRGFGLSISEISICELLSGATIKQEQEGYRMLSIFKRYLIDPKSLIAAAQIATLYHKENVPSGQISIADRI